MTHHHFRVSNSASAFASHICALHEEIREKIIKNDAEYKASTGLHHRLRIFNVGDYVMIRMRAERFPPGTVKKLHARSAWPFRILKKINSNAYMVDLPADFGISSIFNVEDLVPYRVPLIPLLTHSCVSLAKTFLRAPLPPLPLKLSYAT